MENSSNPASPASTDVVDFTRLKELFGDDDAVIQRLLDTFVTTTPSLLDQLDTALVTGNFVAAKALGHQIAGSAANLGAQRMYLLARELEKAAEEQAGSRCHGIFDDIAVAFIEVCDLVSSTR